MQRLIAPLHNASRLHNRARFLQRPSYRQEVHFRFDFGRFVFHVGRIPKRCCFCHVHVIENHPVEVSNGVAQIASVCKRLQRVLAKEEIALDNAFLHQVERILQRAFRGVVNFGQPVVTVVVFCGSVFAKERLQERHKELRLVRPVAVSRRFVLEILANRAVVYAAWPLQVARHRARIDAHVGAALHVWLATQCCKLAARHANVA